MSIFIRRTLCNTFNPAPLLRCLGAHIARDGGRATDTAAAVDGSVSRYGKAGMFCAGRKRSRATASGKTPEEPRRMGVDFFCPFFGCENSTNGAIVLPPGTAGKSGEVFAFIREYSGNQVSLRHECAKLCNENGIRKRKCRKNKTKIRKHSAFLLAKT